MILYSYGLSSASFRVRIALALKGIAHDTVTLNLKLGEHHMADYREVNAQGFVPALQLEDGALLNQSLAIIEYLDEIHPKPPLLPADALGRARVRALCQLICSDVHPLDNLRVLRYLEQTLKLDAAARDAWYRHWIEQGFAALERLLQGVQAARYCHGDSVTLADLCLVPQVFNARRFAVDVDPYPRIVAIDAACRELPAFGDTAPQLPR